MPDDSVFRDEDKNNRSRLQSEEIADEAHGASEENTDYESAQSQQNTDYDSAQSHENPTDVSLETVDWSCGSGGLALLCLFILIRVMENIPDNYRLHFTFVFIIAK